MNPFFDKRVPKFLTAMELRQMMDAAGVSGNPIAEDLWEWALSPLADGKHAERATQRLVHFLTPRLYASQFLKREIPIVSDVPKDLAVILCFEKVTNKEIAIHQDTFTGHTLIVGTTGAGKTSFIAWLISQLLARGIRVRFIDHKGEGRRFLHLFPSTMIFRPEREFINFLEPVGTPEIYWAALFAEIGKARNLHIENSSELTDIMKRVADGMKLGDPFPSPQDFVQILLTTAEKEGRPKLRTAALALKSLLSVLGRTASIRKPPAWESRYPLVIYEYGNVPSRDRQFLSAVWLLRMQMQAMSEGHDHRLREVVISDEAIYEFGQEFHTGSGSNYISVHKRLITQSRSFGIGAIAGAQIPSEIDGSLKANATTFVSLRLTDIRDAKEAQQLLLLPDDHAQKILSLRPGEVLIRSAGFTQGVLGWYPKIELGPYLSDKEVDSHIASEISWLEQNTIYSPEKTQAKQPLSYLEILGEVTESKSEPAVTKEESPKKFFGEHREFLRRVQLHSTASVTEHYRALGWGVSRANRVKGQLLEMGLMASERQPVENGRPKEILTLTTKGKSLLENAQS